MKNFYLVSAILGAIIPWFFFAGFIQDSGLDLSAFLTGLFVNGAAGGFSADLLITSVVFWVFMVHQYRHKQAPHPALFIILNLGIGLSCALPAYLFSRQIT